MLICQFNNVGEPIENKEATTVEKYPDTYKAYKESLVYLEESKNIPR
jgi:hypothetical protein